MSIKEPGRHLRTNYRLTGGKVDTGALESLIVAQSFASVLDAVGGCTISMAGYGNPNKVWFDLVSLGDALGGSICHAGVAVSAGSANAAISGSLVFPIVNLMASAGAEAAAAVTARIICYALIASR